MECKSACGRWYHPTHCASFYFFVTPSIVIIPKYIKLKHFNPKFPENHNIKYKDNIFFIKRNDEWNIINSNTLSNKLFDDGGSEVFYHLNMFDDQIKNNVKDDDIYEDIKLKSNYSELESKGQDIDVKNQLLDIAKRVSEEKSVDPNVQLQALIAADKETPHGFVVGVIDTVRRQGITDLAINVENSGL